MMYFQYSRENRSILNLPRLKIRFAMSSSYPPLVSLDISKSITFAQSTRILSIISCAPPPFSLRKSTVLYSTSLISFHPSKSKMIDSSLVPLRSKFKLHILKSNFRYSISLINWCSAFQFWILLRSNSPGSIFQDKIS